ncbi:MAG: YicC family protein [Bacteroidales bacterium]|nr:YicC family protein [Bacteroidales bacterium]
MQYSMTGFAKLQFTDNIKTVYYEIKSLNSKGLDINIKLPLYYKELEFDCRARIAEKLIRGKIDAVVYIEWHSKIPYLHFNESLISEYYNSLSQISKKYLPENYKPDWLDIILKLPDVIQTSQISVNDEEKSTFLRNFDILLSKLEDTRKLEGDVITNDILLIIEIINRKIEIIQNRIPEVIENIKGNIIEKLKTLNVNYDKNKFEEEMIYYLDKLDFNEELVRLKKHTSFFEEVVKNEKYSGKKLTFIAQEMLREANTISSKCNDFIIQKEVVEVKNYIEKIKEQLANIV